MAFGRPDVRAFKDAATGLNAVATGEVSPADARAIRRLVPYQNLFYTRWLFDKLETGIAGEGGE